MLAAVAFAAAQDDDMAKAEKIFNTSCMACHELRKIQTQALDAEGWTKIVDSMVQKGAKVEKADIPSLVGYLEANFGPLPDGDGKKSCWKNARCATTSNACDSIWPRRKNGPTR